MLSSTPLEMDDDLMFSNITNVDQKEEGEEADTKSLQTKPNSHNENQMQQSVYYDVNNTNYFQQQLELNEKRIEELTHLLTLKDTKINDLAENLKLKQTECEQQTTNFNSSMIMSSSPEETNNLLAEIEILKRQLDDKSMQISDLNACLVKQTSFCENLSDLLKKSEQKNGILNEEANARVNSIKTLESELGTFSSFLLLIEKFYIKIKHLPQHFEVDFLYMY